MELTEARTVQAGDSVLFEGRRQAVLQVSDDGLWSPYFDLEQDGRVSHVLVEPLAERAPVSASA